MLLDTKGNFVNDVGLSQNCLSPEVVKNFETGFEVKDYWVKQLSGTNEVSGNEEGSCIKDIDSNEVETSSDELAVNKLVDQENSFLDLVVLNRIQQMVIE